MPPFSAIVFDTNSLRGEGWPRVDADLENLFQLARIFEIDLYIPDPVKEELEEFWRRGAAERILTLETALNKVLKDQPDNQQLKSVKLRSADERVSEVLKRAEKASSEWNIKGLPITKRSCEELFHLAATKTPPFQESDKGFKDAVILLSAIDHLKPADNPHGLTPTVETIAFISEDTDFDGSPLLMKTPGVEVRIFGDVSALVKVLEERMTAAVKGFRKRDSDLARVALAARTAEIVAFLKKTVKFPQSSLLVYGKVIEVKELAVDRLLDVRTTYLSEDAGEPTKISADVAILVGVTTERYESEAAPPLGVGDAASLFPSLGVMKREEQQVTTTVSIEATANRTETGYENIAFVSAKVKPTNRYSGLAALAGLAGSNE